VRLLLDTHLLLWAAARSARLPREARELLQDDSNDVYYSAASIWEIAIKSSLRRKDFRVDLTQLLATLPEMGLVELPVTAAHAAGVTRLPPIHRDPFDRLLIAQSIVESLTLLTNDALLDYRVGARVV
jgi:PIN domain nuclease of toxin-antitoxin system